MSADKLAGPWASYNTCPECGADLIMDQSTGEVTCPRCGLVVDTSNVVDRGPEWRTFEAEDMNSKPRATPLLMPALSYGTRTILTRRFSSDRDTQFTIHRLRKLQTREKTTRARNFTQALNEFFLLGDRAHVPRTLLNQAADIYRRAYSHGLVRGRSIRGTVAGSIYAAYRIQNTPRSLKEMAEAMNVEPQELANVYRLILKELHLSPANTPAEEHVPRLAEALGLTWKEQKAAIDLLREARRLKHTAGKDPWGLAAGAIYIATRDRAEGHKITQRAIAEATGVSEVTIRNRYKPLEEVTA